MSSFFRIFDVAASGMAAQSVRLNTTASNLANADSVASTPDGAYRAKEPVFAAIKNRLERDASAVGVRVAGVTESPLPIGSRFEPENPLADANGNVYTPNVNPVDEMVNMISASRSYQNDVEVIDTAKRLLTRTLDMGK